MINIVLCSRKAALDQLLDGLSVLGFHELMATFPVSFERILCACEAEFLHVDSSQLLSMVTAECTTEEETLTYELVKRYILSLDQEGMATEHYSNFTEPLITIAGSVASIHLELPTTESQCHSTSVFPQTLSCLRVATTTSTAILLQNHIGYIPYKTESCICLWQLP